LSDQGTGAVFEEPLFPFKPSNPFAIFAQFAECGSVLRYRELCELCEPILVRADRPGISSQVAEESSKAGRNVHRGDASLN
jgi:hypothetical protein